MGFLSSLRASIEDLVEALVEPGSNILEEEAQLQAASYVCWEVLPTSTLNPNPNLTLSLTVALTRCCRRCSSTTGATTRRRALRARAARRSSVAVGG